MIVKPVIGYEGLYEIDEHGDVYSLCRHGTRHCAGRYKLSPNKNRKGYKLIYLTKESKTKGYAIHRLVAQNFIGAATNDMQVDHIDGNKENNHYSNLEYVTCKENVRRAWTKGLIKKPRKGSGNSQSKLDENKVTEIKKQISAGRPLKEIASEYGVDYTNIWQISKGKTWVHVVV